MTTEAQRLRTIVQQLAQTPFRKPWQWRIEIDDYSKTVGKDFDLFVREVTYGPIEIETEQEKVGMQTLTWPVAAAPVSVSMTVRDHQDRRVSRWFAAATAKIYNDDGTQNLPKDYLITMRRFSLLDDGKEEETDVWEVIPTQLGDVTESKDADGLLEFPITFIQFRA